MSGRLNLSVFAVLLAGSALVTHGVAGESGTPLGNGSEVCGDAVLRNGFTMQHVRPEVVGAATRLWLCGDAGAGYVEIPSENIQSFELRQSAVPLPPAALSGASQKTSIGTLPIPVKDGIKDLIASTALRHQIDPDFVASVVKAESGFNPAAVSPKGAKGLMQLMPRTAAGLGVTNVLDPAANLEGGTKYLRQLLDKYDSDAVKALAAYNAGPQRVEQYAGIPPYRETHAYVARIIDDYNRKKLQQQAPSTSTSPPASK